jgi:hypothetical protein
VFAAKIAKDVRHEKDIVWSNFLLDRNSSSPEQTPKLSERILTAIFRASHWMRSDFERLCKQPVFCAAKLDVNIADCVPGNRAHVSESAQFRKNFSGHPLHTGVLNRPAGTGHVDEDAHFS